MVVFDHRRVECTPECFSSKNDAEKNLRVVYAPVYSSLRKSGRATSLAAACALACFFSTKRSDKLRQTMSSRILVSSVTMLSLGGVVVDLTHGKEATLHLLVDIALPRVNCRIVVLLDLELNGAGPAVRRWKCGGGALSLDHHGRKNLGDRWEAWTRPPPRHHWEASLLVPTSTAW